MAVRGAPSRSRAELSKRLWARRPELEQATLARVHGVADAVPPADTAYLAGLRTAVSTALAHGIAAIEDGAGRSPPRLPAELSAQARYAARTGVCLDTVLRRYFAGYALLCDFIVEEAKAGGLIEEVELQGVLRTEAALLDHLVIAVTAEYTQEAEGLVPQGVEQHRAERVRGLLAGEFVDSAELGYELDAWHLGLASSGPGARAWIPELAGALGRIALIVRAEGETIWAWLGGRERIDVEEALAFATRHPPPATRLALGEPAHGLGGWRLTHRQAAAALPISLRGPKVLVRYADVALFASILRDDILMRSLSDLYLAPLAAEPDGGEALRQTLRAYFACERNVSSAAASLGISRKTVASRLRLVERRLGRPLGVCASGVEAALGLEELGEDAAIRL